MYLRTSSYSEHGHYFGTKGGNMMGMKGGDFGMKGGDMMMGMKAGGGGMTGQFSI